MQLCIALDLPTQRENLALVEQLQDLDVWLKVGLRSYIRDGESFLRQIRAIHPRAKIFLDLKLYDIPNTMADAAESIMGLGVDMFNIHASSGPRAMESVMHRLSTYTTRPIVLAVSALTSFDLGEFDHVYGASIEDKVAQFSRDAHMAGLDGMVCSVYESLAIKSLTHPQFLTLTPGIRPFGESADDQARVATIADAKRAHVDFAVVGRPIYRADAPKKVVETILESMA